jgi:hypothetical protein
MNANWLSVPELALHLGISEGRVRQRIADGSLPAESISGRWTIPVASLRAISDVRWNRPLSERMAWAVLRYLVGNAESADIDWLAASERLRARGYANRLRNDADPAPLMRAWFKKRADRQVFRAAKDDVGDLLSDDRVRLSGLALRDSGIVAPGIVEGYVSPQAFLGLVEDYFLVAAEGADANVILHVTIPMVDPATAPVIAADLADYNGPREDGRVEELVHAVR